MIDLIVVALVVLTVSAVFNVLTYVSLRRLANVERHLEESLRVTAAGRRM
jgi:hypothetical protein